MLIIDNFKFTPNLSSALHGDGYKVLDKNVATQYLAKPMLGTQKRKGVVKKWHPQCETVVSDPCLISMMR